MCIKHNQTEVTQPSASNPDAIDDDCTHIASRHEDPHNRFWLVQYPDLDLFSMTGQPGIAVTERPKDIHDVSL